jgi:hypothetical protein
MIDMTDAARAILLHNDRGGYTIPTDSLYPFQRNWDSAFVSMGFTTFDTDRAYQELERFVEGQWDDGMLPHIVFHVPSETYFLGPDVWKTDNRHPKKPTTSDITQPPVFGISLRYIYETALVAGRHNVLPRTRLLFHAALPRNLTFFRDIIEDPESSNMSSALLSIGKISLESTSDS